ncbi:PREDICTED: uncharacterized protein At3g28850 [Nicotiana attenuata]|uniref:Glutaredoxin domain-containing protein n=1 Tax=Nicotiana attenuata TaxID=49451 RepID=A0A314KP64_NICAT|nr:PREDICTED: uncharacterized protein At3g28850 [Nicotiana attenuata]OIT31136.1 uncharacterized protein A4A49_24919 [Nicotiana attenuata]
MGCVSSKLFRNDFKQEILCKNGEDYTHHIVSLTSSTYGALNLDKVQNFTQNPLPCIKECVIEVKKSPPRDVSHEVINTWELMEGLDEELVVPNSKISPKSRGFLRGFGDIDARSSPLKFLNQMSSPRKLKKFGGKENKGKANGVGNFVGRSDFSPKNVLKESKKMQQSPWKMTPRLRNSKQESPNELKCDSLKVDSVVISSRRRSLNPLFDPQLVAAFEKELSEEEEEQIKKMVSVTPLSRKNRNSQEAESMLELFDKICPPGGENAVVIYTTTLRGIRKTFEDCNTARAILESNDIQMFERDISMHSGYKEELRGLMGKKEVKVPLVFVKGRLIGGADEMVKLEEEGKLGILLDGIPRAVAACEGCAGIRFVMCMDCSGSRKVLAKDGKSTVKCGECNENGLIQCPICC